jgi:uncharacterized 2Fe-2S/4Fe-4S cluster protein (DUF4445 family)
MEPRALNMEHGTWNLELPAEGGVLLALDLGTTTLAGRLLAAGGAILAEASLANPQRLLGADILRRLEASLAGEGARLQRLLVDGIEALLTELLRQSGRERGEITAAAAAGNTAISHLLCQLPVESILFPPHRPRERHGDYVDPAALGLDLPVPLYLFPAVSGYVGGDTVAFLYGLEGFCPSHLTPPALPSLPLAPRLYIDLGTNAEIALFDGQNWRVTSAAAGPAFEGGNVACGMAAQPGAVCGVRSDGEKLHLTVLGGGPPRGICGSGLLAAVAAALEGGLIDTGGRIVAPGEVPTNLSRHIVETPAGRALRLYRDASGELLLSQDDIRQFQLAKGAVHAAVLCLLERSGLAPDALAEVVISGALGFAIDPKALKKVALLPSPMVEKAHFLPSGALAGVGRFLHEQDAANLRRFAGQLKPFPLSGTPRFEELFLRSLIFDLQ